MIRKWIKRLLVLVYVFMLPVSYQHFKASWIERGNPWDDDSVLKATFLAGCWPLAYCLLAVAEYQDYSHWKAQQKARR